MTAHGLLGLSIAAVLALSGCSGDDSGDSASPDTSGSSSSDSSSPTATEKPYLPVPEGVELTPQGTELELGEKAVVAYEPRQGQVGALDIKVTRLEKTSFKESFKGWKLDDATKKTNPYFVHATVKNVGKTDLGGRRVPLYIVDGTNTLIESSTFASTFKPCPSKAFPEPFKGGDKTDVCLVYLAPDKGKLTAVSFRPTQEFDPITWTGDFAKPKPPQVKDNKGVVRKGG